MRNMSSSVCRLVEKRVMKLVHQSKRTSVSRQRDNGLALVASPSFTDVFSANLSCNDFPESSKDDNISHCISNKRKQFPENKSGCEKSLETLPQEILVKILCGVEHDDLKRLFHVSKPIREVALIAKELHFGYNTPKKILSDEIEVPNAPKRPRLARRIFSASICVSLFTLDEEHEEH